MLNIISNVNPKIKITLNAKNSIVDFKTLCVSQKEAEELYVDLLSKPSYEWLDIEFLDVILSEYDNDVFDPRSDYELLVDFDNEFINYMESKYPNKNYENTIYDECDYEY